VMLSIGSPLSIAGVIVLSVMFRSSAGAQGWDRVGWGAFGLGATLAGIIGAMLGAALLGKNHREHDAWEARSAEVGARITELESE